MGLSVLQCSCHSCLAMDALGTRCTPGWALWWLGRSGWISSNADVTLECASGGDRTNTEMCVVLVRGALAGVRININVVVIMIWGWNGFSIWNMNLGLKIALAQTKRIRHCPKHMFTKNQKQLANPLHGLKCHASVEK